MSPGGLTISSGGVPSAEALAALTAALTVLVEGERRASADPTPAVYRSRWRRASLIESSEVSGHLKHDSAPWGVH